MSKKKKPGKGRRPKQVEQIVIPFKGVDYIVRRDDVDDMELFELIEDGKAITATRQVLGNEQWTKFKESARNPRTGRISLDSLNDFLNILMEKIGELSGNS